MQGLKSELKSKLKNASRIAVLGIGSELRADDAVGVEVARAMDEALGKNKDLKFILAHSAPENFSGEIISFKPTHLIIIDSADLGEAAGTIKLIKEDEIAGVSFSTHRLPTKTLMDYLKTRLDCAFIIIGIQPKTLQFGAPLSPEVQEAVKTLSNVIQEILSA